MSLTIETSHVYTIRYNNERYYHVSETIKGCTVHISPFAPVPTVLEGLTDDSVLGDGTLVAFIDKPFDWLFSELQHAIYCSE